MDNNRFIEICKDMIINYLQSSKCITEDELVFMIKNDGIYVVWLCKTLQNNKALLSTTMNDKRYYEITYNGDENEIYFDSYVKERNVQKSLDKYRYI